MDNHLIRDKSMFEDVTAKSVAKYALLPGVIPMIRRFAERCGQFLFLFTTVFGAVGLIDKNHPCLRPENIGRYRFFDIIGLATHNVVFDKKHIPQIIMFFATILTLILTMALLVAVLSSLFIHTSTAYAQAYYGLESAQAANDWSYQFLGRFFGDTGMNFWGGNAVDPNMSLLQPMFRAMIKHYSIAIMVIAVFMIIYMAVTRLAETARTGEPFGKSFNSVWGPVRIVMCIGLLVPIGTGYNAAQLITFQVAEWGGALATNVWNAGLDNVGNSRFVVPNRPDYGFKFIRGVFLIHSCMAMWNMTEGGSHNYDLYARPWMSSDSAGNSEMVTMKFGPHTDKSFCGEIMFSRVRTAGTSSKLVQGGVNLDTFAIKVEKAYQEIIADYLGAFTVDVPAPYAVRGPNRSVNAQNGFPWDVEDGSPISRLNRSMYPYIEDAARECVIEKKCKYDDIMPVNGVESWVHTYWTKIGYPYWSSNPGTKYDPVNDQFFNTPAYKNEIQAINQKAIDILKSGQKHGWASAGSFYLRLTEIQNIITGAVDGRPVVTKLPVLYGTSMNSPNFKANISAALSGVCTINVFGGNVNLCPSSFINLGQIHSCLNQANNWFVNNPLNNPEFVKRIKYDSIFKQETMDLQDGGGLIGAADNSLVQRLSIAFTEAMKIDREDLNPLGTLIALGGTYLSVSSVLYIVGAILSVFQMTTLANVAENLGNILVIVGFTLFVVVPMMPFIHFLFAVVEWVMSVFEAVVGMPLWCLTFLSLSGESLMDPAKKGMLMLFEIMLRPTIIIFSLVGAVLLFTASIAYINDAYMYFKGNAEGAVYDNYKLTLPFTWFTFALMHTFIVYSLANSCFKLLDWMPNSFMRWYENVSGFGELAKVGLPGADPRVVTGLIEKYNKNMGPSAMIGAAGAAPGKLKKGAAAVLGGAQKAGQNFSKNMNNMANMPLYPGGKTPAEMMGGNTRQGGVNGDGNARPEDENIPPDPNNDGDGHGGDNNGSGNTENNMGGSAQEPETTSTDNQSPQQESPSDNRNNNSRWTPSSTGNARLNYTYTTSRNKKDKDDKGDS